MRWRLDSCSAPLLQPSQIVPAVVASPARPQSSNRGAIMLVRGCVGRLGR